MGNNREGDKERLKGLHFDPWLLPTPGSPLAQLSDDLSAIIPQPAVTPGRKPRADAMERRKLALSCLLANLAQLAHMQPHMESLLLPLKKTRRSPRYDRPGFNADVLREIKEVLEADGWITVEPAVFKQSRTALAPSDKLLEAVQGCTNQTDLLQGGELIELWDKPDGRHKELADYEDTDETIRMRAEMESLSTFLAGRVVTLDGRVMPPQRLIRRFTGSFDRGGRFFAWWQNVPKAERWKLQVDGEPIVDLDFSAMFVRLAYAMAGAEMPMGDPYALPNLEERQYRPAVKKLFNSLFFRAPGKTAKRIPLELASGLPAGFTMRDFTDTVWYAHRPIHHLVNTECGYTFFRQESDIMVSTLLKLAGAGVLALGVHDGLMVPESARELAIGCMKKASLERLSVELEVTEKTIFLPNPK